MARVNFEDDRTPLDDLVALHTADDAGELHRRLLCFGPVGGARSDAFEPWCLFHHIHGEEPEGAVVTALLLLTVGRWCNATGRLVRRIEESGIVRDDELDLLAQTFLAAGPEVFWEAPDDWFTGPPIVLDPGDPDVAGVVEVLEDDEAGDPEDGPVVFAREVRPPLRRWAAARAVRSDPGRWRSVVQAARRVDARGGAAVIHGLLDGIGLLTPAARGFVLDLAERWPQRRVREAALALRKAPAEPVPAEGSAAGSEVSPAPGGPAAATTQPSLF